MSSKTKKSKGKASARKKAAPAAKQPACAAATKAKSTSVSAVSAAKAGNGKSSATTSVRKNRKGNGTAAKPKTHAIELDFELIKQGANQGVYVSLPDGSKRKISPPMDALGHIVDPDGGNPAVRIKLRTPLGDVRGIEIAKNDFKNPRHLLGKLIEKGLSVDHELSDDRAKLIHAYLRKRVPDEIRFRAKQDGWLRLPNTVDGYVLGEQLYHVDEQYLVARDPSIVSGPEAKGDLNTWLYITRRIGDDPVAVLMLCAGLASVLLHPLGRDATFVIIVADSGKGKTTILKLVSALFGSPSSMATWEATENGLEAAAKKYQHKPFVVDEVGQGDGRRFGKVAYRLTNLSGKLRADSSSNLAENARTTSVILSAGEQSPIAMMMASGMDIKAGQRARLICIPVSEKYGVWSKVKTFHSGAEKSKQLAAMVRDCHGVAGAAFCKHVAVKVNDLAKEYAAVAPKLRKEIAKGIKLSPDDGVGDRVLENFVLFGYAGKLAIDAGVVKWTRKQILHAMQHGFASWYVEHQRSLPVTDAKIMQQLRLFFQSKRGTKFKSFSRFNDKHAGDVAGYEHTMRNGERLFLAYPAYFEKEICKGFDKKRIINLLMRHELLMAGPRDVPIKQFKVPNEKSRNASFYAIRQSILLE